MPYTAYTAQNEADMPASRWESQLCLCCTRCFRQRRFRQASAGLHQGLVGPKVSVCVCVCDCMVWGLRDVELATPCSIKLGDFCAHEALSKRSSAKPFRHCGVVRQYKQRLLFLDAYFRSSLITCLPTAMTTTSNCHDCQDHFNLHSRTRTTTTSANACC